MSATPTSARRSEPSTSRPLTRESSAITRSSTWAPLSARTLYYYPSGNPLADLGPANLQTSSIAQNRTLTNAAVHSDFSYAKGIHNIKAGAQYGQTFLRENDSLGMVGSNVAYQLALRGRAMAIPLPGYSSPLSMRRPITALENPNYLPRRSRPTI